MAKSAAGRKAKERGDVQRLNEIAERKASVNSSKKERAIDREIRETARQEWNKQLIRQLGIEDIVGISQEE